MLEQDDETQYVVLVNEEDQYSLWPSGMTIPHGWRGTGKQGSSEDCKRYIDEVWTDMRPLSVRRSIGRANTEPQ